jgi:hypothetical protein
LLGSRHEPNSDQLSRRLYLGSELKFKAIRGCSSHISSSGTIMRFFVYCVIVNIIISLANASEPPVGHARLDRGDIPDLNDSGRMFTMNRRASDQITRKRPSGMDAIPQC